MYNVSFNPLSIPSLEPISFQSRLITFLLFASFPFFYSPLLSPPLSSLSTFFSLSHSPPILSITSSPQILSLPQISGKGIIQQSTFDTWHCYCHRTYSAPFILFFPFTSPDIFISNVFSLLYTHASTFIFFFSVFVCRLHFLMFIFLCSFFFFILFFVFYEFAFSISGELGPWSVLW